MNQKELNALLDEVARITGGTFPRNFPKRPVGRPKGVKWNKITRLTIRLYDASREDIAYIRGVVKQVQAEIHKRNACEAK